MISDTVLDWVYYDELSPTCLRWKRDVIVGRGLVRYRKDEPAGGLNKTLGYYFVQIEKVKYRCHRVIWKIHHGNTPLHIDHINRNRLDNRIANLRAVNQAINNRNASVRKDSKLGISGVIRRNIKGIEYFIVQWWEGKKRMSKSFNVDKLGEDVALQQALLKREGVMHSLNNKGYGYSKDHGKKICDTVKETPEEIMLKLYPSHCNTGPR
jgi:hypothetical protein